MADEKGVRVGHRLIPTSRVFDPSTKSFHGLSPEKYRELIVKRQPSGGIQRMRTLLRRFDSLERALVHLNPTGEELALLVEAFPCVAAFPARAEE